MMSYGRQKQAGNRASLSNNAENRREGREMAKDAYYFSHDANARNDGKIVLLRMRYGAEGYGLYWMMLEVLREQDGYKYPAEEDNLRAMAFQFNYDGDKFIEIVNYCCEIHLFEMEEGFFWSDSLNRRMSLAEQARGKNRENAREGWKKKKAVASSQHLPTACENDATEVPLSCENDATAMPPHSDRNATAMPPYSELDATAMQGKEKKQKKQNNPPKGGLGEMIDEYTDNEELRKSLSDFAQMRKEIKKPLTKPAVKRLFNRLDEISAPCLDRDGCKIAALNESILNGWQGVFQPENFADKAPPPPQVVPSAELDAAGRKYDVRTASMDQLLGLAP